MSTQHQRNTRTGWPTDEDLAHLFDETIEDRLADGAVDAYDAVELSEIVAAVNLARKATGRVLLVLPPEVHQIVNECAKLGVNNKARPKGGNPRSSYIAFLQDESTVAWANERSAELRAAGMQRKRARLEAAEDAADWAEQTFGIRPRGIKPRTIAARIREKDPD